jgi:hypothetical protein
VPYTVWSQGRLIGETDLGFVRIIDQFRSGWFHPNADGERAMPVIAAPLPAMRAFLHRDQKDATGRSLVQPALYGSTLFADLAEALQHLQSLDLELRREDGTVVPTTDIGIQDTHRALELAAEREAEIDIALDIDAEVGDDFMIDADLSDDEPLDPYLDEPWTDWTPDELEGPALPRYQIHVHLLDDVSPGPTT